MKFTSTSLSTMILISGSAILQVTATRGATQISSGRAHTCAIDDKRNLQCWGSNAYGQLGDGSTISRNKPTIISLGEGGRYATQIAAGDTHSCAIDDKNNLKCWGKHFYGKPDSNGDDSYYHRSSPSLIDLNDSQAYATQIAVGREHSCVIDNSNFIRCWGSNKYGQLGDGKRNDLSFSPWDTIDGIDAATQISLGRDHSCAIDILNNLKCWGGNFFGQLGDGTRTHRSTPTSISLGDYTTYATRIALGGDHSCAIDNHNNLKCWGNGYYGYYSPSGIYFDYIFTPTTIPLYQNKNENAAQIALGREHSCAITLDSSDTNCWGSNLYGQLGDGGFSDKINFPKSKIVLGDISLYITQISLGGEHSCTIDAVNQIRCWGDNAAGQLGDGSYQNKNSPTIVILNKGGLPIYAKVLIGVLVPVAAILASIACVFILYRKKKQQGQQLPTQEEVVEDGKPTFPVVDDSESLEKVDVAQPQMETEEQEISVVPVVPVPVTKDDDSMHA
mmetsp:Transcript_19398/g.29046  ORF Transcript_19398/g.29046 Transcript_19398/m.29046 type:complete len:503 (-) Transcript_19398:80-1588(-)